MTPEICALLDWKLFGAWLLAQGAISIFEYWLGKTDKVKAASILELLFNVFKRGNK